MTKADLGPLRYYKGEGLGVIEMSANRKSVFRFLEDYGQWKRGDKMVTMTRLLWWRPKKWK